MGGRGEQNKILYFTTFILLISLSSCSALSPGDDGERHNATKPARAAQTNCSTHSTAGNLTAGQHFAWRFVLFLLLLIFILLLGGLLLFLVGRTADVQLDDILEGETGF